ncbi:hypothetical protein J4E80_006991 [Alternaria sp. BMP 0032]|nr:hypothetical protein J4E80_006991 [Alternaria sp. BMP 0032]
MGPGTNSVDAFIGRLVPTALFLDTYKHLPASASVYHPHVIDTDLYNEELLKDEEVFDVKIQDAVATVLYKISKNILGQFLDDRTTSFKFVQWTEVGGVQGSKLIIWKKESRVLVGSYLERGDTDLLNWDSIVRCVIDSDGSWDLTSATSGGSTRRELHDVWFEKFLRTRWGNDDTTALRREDIARDFSEHMINFRCYDQSWDGEADTKWEITTTMTAS